MPNDAAPQPVLLADYRKPPFQVETVDLAFELRETATVVRSRLSVQRTGSSREMFMNGEALTLLSIARDGVALTVGQYRLEPHGIVVTGMPDTYFVRADGTISSRLIGEISQTALDAELRRVLAR